MRVNFVLNKINGNSVKKQKKEYLIKNSNQKDSFALQNSKITFEGRKERLINEIEKMEWYLNDIIDNFEEYIAIFVQTYKCSAEEAKKKVNQEASLVKTNIILKKNILVRLN